MQELHSNLTRWLDGGMTDSTKYVGVADDVSSRMLCVLADSLPPFGYNKPIWMYIYKILPSTEGISTDSFAIYSAHRDTYLIVIKYAMPS